MEHLKIYENFKDREKLLSIDNACKYYKIKNYKINKDYSIDVDDDVKFSGPETTSFQQKKSIGLKKLPIKFNRVSGWFSCPDLDFETFENFPKSIGDFFYCSNCRFTTFLGCPTVGNSFICQMNYFKDFYGFPADLEYSLYIEYNPVCEILNLLSKSDQYGKREDKNIIRFIRFLNEYLVIRDQNKIIESRLEDALYEVDKNKKLPENLEFKNYRIV